MENYLEYSLDRDYPPAQGGPLVIDITGHSGSKPMEGESGGNGAGKNQITEEQLRTDPQFLTDVGSIYSAFTGQQFQGDPALLADWGIEKLANFDLAMGDMTNMSGDGSGGGMIGQATQILNNFTPEQSASFLRALESYDQLPNLTLPGFGRLVRNLGADPTTYVGAATLGAGLAGRQATRATAKEGIKQALRQRIGQAILNAPIKTAAAEGAAFVGTADAIRQNVEVAGGKRESVDLGQTAISTGVGAVAGAGLAKGIQVAAPVVGKAIKAGMENLSAPRAPKVGPGAQVGAVGDLNAHGQFKFDNEARGVRDELKRVSLTADEKTRVKEVSTASNIPESAISQAFREQIARYPERAGWRRPVLSKASLTKEGKVELEFAKEAYAFNRTASSTGSKEAEAERAALATNMASRLAREVKSIADRAESGDKAAKVIMASKDWYRAMRDRLRSEFGSFGDVFADVIGTTSAQTNVQQNWENAIEVMRRFSRGHYDEALGKLDQWLKNGGTIDSYTKANTDLVKQALPAAEAQAKAEGLKGDALKDRAKSLALDEANKEFPLITKETGKLFNTNSPQTMGALLDLFRIRQAGGSPKTPNFTGNLIGYSDLATIDVWAARTLRRIYDESMGKGAAPRLPPPMEQGVGGVVSADLKEITGEFGFGQDVFRAAAQELRKDPRFAGLGDDDLQAIVWFAEKERWTKNKWTTVQGEGGSLEFEANHAGVSDQAALKRARQMIENDPTKSSREAWAAEIPKLQEREQELLLQINSEADEKKRKALTAELNRTMKKIEKRPEQIAAAEAELAANKAAGHKFLEDNQQIVRRFTGGLSLDHQGKMASDGDMLTGQAELASVLAPDAEVIMLKAQPSTGRYIDPTGKVFDERAFDMEWITRANFDPTQAIRKVVEIAKRNKQQSTFFSEVVKPGAVQTANPGIEVYFKKKLPQSEVDKITQLANQSGLDVGFTFATDLRYQNRGKGSAPSEFVGIRMQYIPEFGGKMTKEEAQLKMCEFSASLRDIDGVSNSQYVEYDTRVFFEGDYDAFLKATPGVRGAEVRQGPSASEGSAGAVRELSQAGAERIPDVPNGSRPSTARTKRKQAGLISDAASSGGGK